MIKLSEFRETPLRLTRLKDDPELLPVGSSATTIEIIATKKYSSEEESRVRIK